MLRSAVDVGVENNWREEILNKQSLRYINPNILEVGKAHPVYRFVRPNTFDVQKAEIKARILMGTYILQPNRAKFNQFEVDPTCRLCDEEPETREHFVAVCSALDDCRKKYNEGLVCTINMSIDQVKTLGNDKYTQLVLDCTHPSVNIYTDNPNFNIEEHEMQTRQLLHKLHFKRLRILENTN